VDFVNILVYSSASFEAIYDRHVQVKNYDVEVVDRVLLDLLQCYEAVVSCLYYFEFIGLVAYK